MEDHTHSYCLDSHNVLATVVIHNIFPENSQTGKTNVDLVMISCYTKRFNFGVSKVPIFVPCNQTNSSIWSTTAEDDTSRVRAFYILFVSEVKQNVTV